MEIKGGEKIMEMLNDRTSEEIAIKLYESCKDMDWADYEDTKEQDIAEIEESLDILKILALYNDWAKILWNILQRIN